MKLYLNEISSAASRVRIALALKGKSVEELPITILGADAENRQADYLKVNPLGLVPALLTDGGSLITQSLAIIEYLDELYPEPPLWPKNPDAKAFARSIALAVAAEIHALLTPRVASRLTATPGFGASGVADWKRHWLNEGMTAVEAMIAQRRTGKFVVGDTPSVADLFLFPQAVNTERAGFNLDQWPSIFEIVTALRAVPAFADNAPAPVK